MAHWQLTEDVYWGDVDSLRERGSRMGSVVCVTDNHDLMEKDGYDVLHLPPPVPYFRVARGDHEEIDNEYMFLLDGVLDLIIEAELFPVLVHCYAGMHRSPAVAIYLAHKMQSEQSLESLEKLREKARRQRDGIREDWTFHKSLMERLTEDLA